MPLASENTYRLALSVLLVTAAPRSAPTFAGLRDLLPYMYNTKAAAHVLVLI